MANYRNKELMRSNVVAPIIIAGRFAIGANGAVGNARPSAGAAATAGQGELFTVTQLATFDSGTTKNAYQVTLTETYFQEVSKTVQYQYSFSTTTAPTEHYLAECSQFDTTTNSFVIFLTDIGLNGGTTPASAVLPAVASSVSSGSIFFEIWFKNTVSPTSL